MAPIKSYSYYDLDNGRPIVQQANQHKNLSSPWQYLSLGKTGKVAPASPLSQSAHVPDIDYSEMADSPDSYQSSSQGSWEANDVLRHRPHSVSSVPANSPLSVNMTQDQLMTFGIYPGEARLVMKIPQENRFRYRYDTEMSGTHGSLGGIRVGKDKCSPTVELVNFHSEALIRVSLVTCNETGERYPHPHSLFVKEKMYQKNLYINWDNKSLTKTGHYIDPHYICVGVNKTDYTAKFEGMCIISSKKENFSSAIKEKLLRRDLEQKYRNHRDGNHWDGANGGEDLTKKVDKGVTLVDVDFVSLCFEAFKEENDKLVQICQPLYSSPIGNAKSAKTGKLKIARINTTNGSCKGGDEIWMLVEKINKKGLAIRFSEEDNGRILWQSCIEGDDLILHHQYAIIFKTPPYRDVNITSPVVVTMRLERSSYPNQPCEYSEPINFVYEPLKNKSTKSDNLYRKESMLTPLKQMHNKRPRTESSSVMYASTYQNKRKPEDSEFPFYPSQAQDLIDIAQILQMSEVDFDGFGQAWSKFNPEEFEKFIHANDIEMPLQKDGFSVKSRREILYNYLRSKLTSLDENDVKKLIDQVNSIKVSRKEKSENKNGIDKGQVEDAASTLLSLRAKIVENFKADVENKNESDIVLRRKEFILKTEDDFNDENDGNTPLHFFFLHSSDFCTKKFQELLHEFRNCINTRNNEGKTPVHLAIESNSLDCLKLLVETGADPSLADFKSQRNALHMAVEKRNRMIAEYLADIGLSFEAPDSQGISPLHIIYELPNEQREEFLSLYYSKKKEQENSQTTISKMANDFAMDDQDSMEKIYQILNESGSWKELAKLWEVSFFVSHAEEAKNPAKNIFHCAEQKHGHLALEDLRNLLDGLNETKAVVIVDEMLARKFI